MLKACRTPQHPATKRVFSDTQQTGPLSSCCCHRQQDKFAHKDSLLVLHIAVFCTPQRQCSLPR